MEHNATIAGGVTLVSSTVYLALTGKHQMLILDIVMFPALILMLASGQCRMATLARRVRLLGDISYSTYLLHFLADIDRISRRYRRHRHELQFPARVHCVPCGSDRHFGCELPSLWTSSADLPAPQVPSTTSTISASAPSDTVTELTPD